MNMIKKRWKNHIVNLLDGVTARYGHEKPKDNFVDGIPVESKFHFNKNC